jgi:threonine synthase
MVSQSDASIPGGAEMKYQSTRSNEKVTAPEALLRGLAADGGLYVPLHFPDPFVSFDELKHATYEETAVFVLSRFLSDIPERELRDMVHSAYTGTFETERIVPVKTLDESISVAEMFHGRTCAFKDLALSLFPYLLTWARKKLNEDRQILILTATSGDTGKAALEGFRDVPNVYIEVFYPSDGVSPLQKDQMQKQEGNNVRVMGIEGNFDDAQGTLKQIFSSSLRNELAEQGILFSSANSINIGRLLPQVVYYVWIWLEMVRTESIGRGESFNVVVPTGNFGNILAAWYARKIGVPIDQLICASNKNHVLSDVLQSGTYDINREFYTTESPSMDILISSNFERFLYHMNGSAEETSAAMNALKTDGRYTLPENVHQAMVSAIKGDWADEETTAQTIRDVYEKYHYLIDPHTAVAFAVYHAMRRRSIIDKKSHTVIISTAHPYKFPTAMAEALHTPVETSPYDTLRHLAETTGVNIPDQLGALEKKSARFSSFIPRQEMTEEVCRFAQKILKKD